MKTIILLFVTMALLSSSCNKKEKEEAAKEAAIKVEQVRKDSIYKANINSIGETDKQWIRWLIDTKGIGDHQMIVATLFSGETFNYTYEDTVRKGKLPRTISVPKFPPANAYLPGKASEKYAINTWGKRAFHYVETTTIPNPTPAGLIKTINDASLLLGGYIIHPPIGAWFYYDIPGPMDEFDYLAETGVDNFLMAEERYPGILYVKVYEAEERKEEGKWVYEQTKIVGQYYVKEDGSITSK